MILKTACPLCKSDKSHRLYNLKDGFSTHECLSCGFVYMAPRPSQAYLNEYYAKASVYGYASDQALDYAHTINDKVNLIRRFQSQFKQMPISGLAVDFGAGNGTTVKSLEILGFEAMGIEISEAARTQAKALFGVKMIDDDIETLGHETVSFLSLFDVLEHLLEPKSFLDQAFNSLVPNGAILVGVPNFNALDRYVI
jgi:2-polyprenyl-3-methyl-5-hydroxy-6-metoxy-1,4-benzoquinol methylase